MKPTSEILAKLKAVTGPKGFIGDERDMAPYLEERRELFHGGRRPC